MINRQTLLLLNGALNASKSSSSAAFRYFMQEASNLCWAACMQMLLTTLRSDSRSQCLIAQEVIAEIEGSAPVPCCDENGHPKGGDNASCNRSLVSDFISKALIGEGLKVAVCPPRNEHELQRCLADGQLVMIYWNAINGVEDHVALVVDRDPLTGLYHLADPLRAVGKITTVSYADLETRNEPTGAASGTGRPSPSTTAMEWNQSWSVV